MPRAAFGETVDYGAAPPVAGFTSVSTVQSTQIAGLSSRQVLFGSSDGHIGQDALMQYDSTNGRLGLGTSTPTARFSAIPPNVSTGFAYDWYTSAGVRSGVIDAMGQVGVGTTDPLGGVHVARFTDRAALLLRPPAASPSTVNYFACETTAGAPTGLTITSQGWSGFFTDTPAGPLQVNTSGGAVGLVVNTSGHVGIGTTSPITFLDISASSTALLRAANAFTALTFPNTTVGEVGLEIASTQSGHTPALVLNKNGIVNGSVWRLAAYSASTATPVSFRIRNDGVDGDRLVINSSGHVGIGTTAPSALFQIFNGTSAILTATTAGGVGIGTSSPVGRFQIQTTVALTQRLTRIADDANGPGIRFEKARGAPGTEANLNVADVISEIQWVGYQGGGYRDLFNLRARVASTAAAALGGDLELFQYTTAGTTGPSPLFINSSGHIGMGTTAPSGPLQVGTGTRQFTVTTGTGGAGLPAVGIGTSAPAANLHILSTATASLRLEPANAGTTQAAWLAIATTIGGFQFSMVGGTGALIRLTNTEQMVLGFAAANAIGFFGSTGSTRLTVTTITPAAVYSSLVGAQVNQIVESLRAYGLLT